MISAPSVPSLLSLSFSRTSVEGAHGQVQRCWRREPEEIKLAWTCLFHSQSKFLNDGKDETPTVYITLSAGIWRVRGSGIGEQEGYERLRCTAANRYFTKMSLAIREQTRLDDFLHQILT